MVGMVEGKKHEALGWRYASARKRFVAMLVLGVAGGAVGALLGAWRYSLIIGWDIAVLTFLLWTWLAIGPMEAEETKRHSSREDPTRASTDILLLVASLASLVAVGVVLVSASSKHGFTKGMLGGLAVASVALSWLLVHTLFLLRYARLYGTEGGGVDFNQKQAPRYMDFAYLAFTIGMTFQVSDTDLKSSAIRSSALRHALLSYLFGAVILATTVNFVVGLTSGAQ
jgi:uncharacterized membrane protein